MKSKLRTVHVKGTKWKYAISNNEVRIYEPGTKQILKRVPMSDLEDEDGRVLPSAVKGHIDTKIIPSF
mgnify:CR=1 FL=1|jgi:hypothetical protein